VGVANSKLFHIPPHQCTDTEREREREGERESERDKESFGTNEYLVPT